MNFLDDDYDPHWCPECGLPYGVCDCAYRDCRPADYDIGEYHDDEDGDECVFGAECLMPGEHLRSECHNIEMIQAWQKEMNENPG